MILKVIKFVLYNIIRILINSITYCIPRDKKICIFNCLTNSFKKTYGFTHNTKYFYLFLSECKDSGIIPIWITPDKDIVNELNINGYRAYYKYSLLGIYYCLRAKYYILNVDITNAEISNLLSGGATTINLWHGIALKHIGKDNAGIFCKLLNWQKNIYSFLEKKNDYMIANGEYDTNIYKTAFLMPHEKIKILGSPRLDTLFREFKGENMFMMEDIKNILSLKKQGRKFILYVPTYRDTGKNISYWINNNQIKELLRINNITLLCKFHPVDANSVNIENSTEIYKINNNSDINVILKYTDALITDYSSVAFDYLLLDKPIIYFPFDFDEYQATCHGLYAPYEELTAGIKAFNEDELIKAMQDVVDGRDKYQEQRKNLRNKMFKYKDGKNCERVVEWIKSLDKRGE